jgi:hypothetical protein
MLWVKRLSPEVARHHQLEKTSLIGFDSRSPLHRFTLCFMPFRALPAGLRSAAELMRRPAPTLALLLAAPAWCAAQATPTILAWDRVPDHDRPGIRWEVETPQGIVSCDKVQVLVTERRCTALIVRPLPTRIRLRACLATCAAWSPPARLPDQSQEPRQVTIRSGPPKSGARGAVAPDGTSNVDAAPASSNAWTAAGKTTAGANRVGVVVLESRFLMAGNPTSVTWGRVPMGSPVAGAAPSPLRIYVIANPPTSASDIVVSWPTAVAGRISVTSYQGVDQQTPVRSGSPSTASGLSTATSVSVPSAAGDMVIDVMRIGNMLPTVGEGQTLNYAKQGGSDSMGSSREVSTGSTVTMSWIHLNGAWATVAISLQPAGGGSP